MKFLTLTHSPKLTYTRTNRKAIINEAAEVITLYEVTTRIELTLPSIVRGFRDAFYNLLGCLFFPGRLYAY
jgi:hypothetical protein